MKFKDLRNILSDTDFFVIRKGYQTFLCDSDTIEDVVKEYVIDDDDIIFVRAVHENQLFILLKNKNLSQTLDK